MQRNCGEDVSGAVVDEWTGRVMQEHTLNMATQLALVITVVYRYILTCGDGRRLYFYVDSNLSTAIFHTHIHIKHTIP